MGFWRKGLAFWQRERRETSVSSRGFCCFQVCRERNENLLRDRERNGDRSVADTNTDEYGSKQRHSQ